MSIRPILIIPDARLRQHAEPVPAPKDLKDLVADMFDTMYDAPGIGLAGPQIGVMSRVVVMDVTKGEDEKPDPIAMINPEIIWRSEELRIHEEGCLSIPDYYEEVERPDRIAVRYQTVDGDLIEREADGLLATCMQHEIDHLDGKLFIDYLSRLKRERVTKKFQKAARRQVM